MQSMRDSVSNLCRKNVSCSVSNVYAYIDGRRPVYLWSLPLLCIGSVIVTVSKAVPELLAGRFIQAFGASGGFSLGAAVIGDIYKVEERGAALGVFYGVRVHAMFFFLRCVLMSGLYRPLCLVL